MLARAVHTCLLLAISSSVLAQSQLTYLDAVAMPAVKVDGLVAAKIHTQGLYVTENYWLVTGRLETKPKRALLIRISRKDPAQFEVVDLTPASDESESLDHPGGFDRDATGVFWIPVSTSNRAGPTVLYGITIDDEIPLSKGLAFSHSIRIEDHIGAICCLENGDLLGANWDTKAIHEISLAGKTFRLKKKSWDALVSQQDWQLAVQDWKFDPISKMVVASGIDKSPQRNATHAPAVIAWIDSKSKTASPVRLEQRNDVARPLTNEGMAIVGDELFLLPEDFGRGAKVLRYRLQRH